MVKNPTQTNLGRREFIRSTALTGAAIALSPMIAPVSSASKSDDLNIAVIGAGAQGMTLLEASLKIPGLHFAAVCDIWPYHLDWMTRRLKAYGHNCAPYADYHEMLKAEKDLDGVIIATPDFWHSEHTAACLEAGINVYCEKEMSNTLEGARKMVEAARRTGKLLQIGHQRRSNPRYIHCYHKLITEAGILGRITTVNGQWNRAAQGFIGCPKGKEMDTATLKKYGYESMTQLLNWRWYKGLGGGPMVDLGSHQIDIYNWFLGAQPRCVTAHGAHNYFDKATHQWPDNVMAIYEYDTPTGSVSAFYQTIASNSCNGYFEAFMGNEGTLVISEPASRCGVYPEPHNPKDHWDKWVRAGYIDPPKEEPKKEPEIPGVVDVRESVPPPKYLLPLTPKEPYHQAHLQNFFNAIRGKEKLNCPAEIGYETAVCVLKVNQSIEAGRKLSFTPDEFKV